MKSFNIINPYQIIHKNGTSQIFNLPVASTPADSVFKFLTTNTTEVARIDGNGLMPINVFQRGGVNWLWICICK